MTVIIMGLWPQTTAVTPLETPSFQGLGFPLAEHPVFLGVNLLTKGPVAQPVKEFCYLRTVNLTAAV